MQRTLILGFTMLLATALAAGCGSGSPLAAPLLPTITAVTPASGGIAGGTEITLVGSNLANTAPGGYQVMIGGQPAAKITVIDGTEVKCETPPGTAGAADVQVVNEFGEGTAAGGFMYYPPPTLSLITADSGSRDGGETVLIEGTGFLNNDPGDTIAYIELKECTNIQVLSDTQLQARTPPSFTEVGKDVIVRNRNGEALLSKAYTYIGPRPVIIDPLSPDIGPRSGGTPVAIVGDFFTQAGGPVEVFFGDALASLVNVTDEQNLTCFTPNSAVSGFVDVKIQNNNGANVYPGAFYYIPPPILTSITPTDGILSGGTPVTVTGSGFLDAGAGTPTVLFGGAGATAVSVNSDIELTCLTPPGPLGLVDVGLATGNGSAETIVDGFEYTLPTFWWENTWGTPSPSPGDTDVYAVPLPHGFPYFGVPWSSVNAVSDGHIDFGAAHTNYSTSDTLFPHPHISMMGQDMYTRTSTNIHATSHLPDRTVITYDNVPEYSTVGANSVQVHLHSSGIFAIVYKACTFHATTFWTLTARVAVNPGGGTNVPVDFTTGGPYSGGATDCLNEPFSGGNDLSNSVLMFIPNSQGGYDAIHTVGVPTDPNP